MVSKFTVLEKEKIPIKITNRISNIFFINTPPN